MSKGHTRRTHLCKGRKAAAVSSAGPVKSVSHSTSKMESMQPSADRAPGLKPDGLADPDGLANLKLFVKPRSVKPGQVGSQRDEPEDSASTTSTFSTDVGSTDNSSEGTEIHPSFRKKLADIEDERNWTLVETGGVKPIARFNHGAAVVGRKLLIIGGETGSGTRNDVQMLHLGKLSWTDIGFGDSAPSKGLPVKTGPKQELPNCKGHSLIAWGKTVILVGGQTDPPTEKVAVWSFDLEMDCWTAVVTKGEIPIARSGQSVTRAGSILIMFGGEDLKGRKLNDLNILDLKSLMWLPLHPSGKGPSARARHVADMYDDRFLFIFGGETKSKMSNDTYALDFDNMEWAKLKTKGIPAAPRAGHAGALVGNMWYIVGGDCRGPGLLGTAVLDMSKMEWGVVASTRPDSVASLQGLSLVFVHRKDKRYLVAFGGYGTQASSSVQVLHIPLPERKTLAGLLEIPTTPDFNASSRSSQLARSQHGSYNNLMGSSIPCACVSVAKNNIESAIDRRSSSQRSTTSISLAEFSAELDRDSGLIPLRTRYAMTQNSMARLSTSSSESMTRRPPSQGSNWDSGSSSRRRDIPLPRLENPPSPAAGSEGSESQHQSAQRVRGDLQSTEITAPSVDSGFLNAEELQITAPSVRPGLVSSVGDAGNLFLETHESVSGRSRAYKGGSQGPEFSGYSETFVSGAGERRIREASITDSTCSVDSYLDRSLGSTRYACPNGVSSRTTPGSEQEDKLQMLSNHINEGSLTDSTSSVDSYSTLSVVSKGCASSPNGISSRTIPGCEEEDELHVLSKRATPGYLEVKLTVSSNRRTADSEDVRAAAKMSNSTIPQMEEDESLVLSRIHTATSAEDRRIAIAMLRQCHEGKLAAAMRAGELFAGQCAEALRDRDEAERTLSVVKHSVQRMEGKLSVALKQIKNLQDRLSATEQAREESNNLVHNLRVENLKLDHSLALKTAVLGEFQKELQTTRGVLIAEGTRAFQLEVELTDLKQKLQSSSPPGHLAPCLQQPILA